MKWTVPVAGLQIAVRSSAGSAIALALAAAAGLQHPIYAAIAAIIVTDLERSETKKLGWRRVLATAIGAPCGAALAMVFPPGPIAVGASIFAAMLLCNIVGAKEGAKVAGYTCGIVILTHGSDPWVYAFFRFIETILGIAVAWTLSFVPRLLGSDGGR